MQSRRKKQIVLISLVVYWLILFTLTHIPLSRDMLNELQASDKKLHFMAYMILTIILRLALIREPRISFRSKKVWMILFITIIYSVVDEVIQGWVGRSCDIHDIYANIAGIFSALVLMSIFQIYLSLLIATSLIIVIMTSAAQLQGKLSHLRPLVYFILSSVFMYFWLKVLQPWKKTKVNTVTKYFIAALVPALFVSGVWYYSVMTKHSFGSIEAASSYAGQIIFLVILLLTHKKNHRSI